MEEIKNTVAQMSLMFTKQMAEFTEELHRNPASTCETSLATRFQAFKEFVISALQVLQCQLNLLDRKTDDLEARSRRNILILHGVAEDKKESVSTVVHKVIVEKLKISSCTPNDIGHCHRMGKQPSGKPRAILVEFQSLAVRGEVWFSKTQLKGTGITLSEFLTKTRHDIFMAARQRFGLTRCWTRDGSVFVMGTNGVRHRVNCLADLEKVEAMAAAKPQGETTVANDTTIPRSRRTKK